MWTQTQQMSLDIQQETGMLKNNAMLPPLTSTTKYSIPAAFLLTLVLFAASQSWAKGPLDGDIADFDTHIFTPILIRSQLCSTVKDCDKHRYLLCTSWNSLSCGVYGITDEKIIKEIFLAMLNSGLKVSHFSFWRSKYHDKSFLEKPILEFIDHTGGK
jgi:hypothetical protein